MPSRRPQPADGDVAIIENAGEARLEPALNLGEDAKMSTGAQISMEEIPLQKSPITRVPLIDVPEPVLSVGACCYRRRRRCGRRWR
jgi:hypothetical protein